MDGVIHREGRRGRDEEIETERERERVKKGRVRNRGCLTTLSFLVQLQTFHSFHKIIHFRNQANTSSDMQQ